MLSCSPCAVSPQGCTKPDVCRSSQLLEHSVICQDSPSGSCGAVCRDICERRETAGVCQGQQAHALPITATLWRGWCVYGCSCRNPSSPWESSLGYPETPALENSTSESLLQPCQLRGVREGVSATPLLKSSVAKELP